MPIPPLNKPATMSQRLGFQDPDLTTPEHDAMVFWTKDYLKRYFAIYCTDEIGNLVKELGERTDRAIKLFESINNDQESFCLKDKINQLIDYDALLNFMYDYQFKACQAYVKDMKWAMSNEDRLKKKKDLLKILTGLTDRFDSCIELLNSDWELSFEGEKTCNVTLERPIVKYGGFQNNYSSIIGYADLYAESRFPRITFSARDSHHIYFHLYCVDADKDETWKLKKAYVEVKPRIQSFGELLRQIRTYETVTGKGSWYVACPDTRFKDDLEDEGVKFIQITEDYKDYL